MFHPKEIPQEPPACADLPCWGGDRGDDRTGQLGAHKRWVNRAGSLARTLTRPVMTLARAGGAARGHDNISGGIPAKQCWKPPIWANFGGSDVPRRVHAPNSRQVRVPTPPGSPCWRSSRRGTIILRRVFSDKAALAVLAARKCPRVSGDFPGFNVVTPLSLWRDHLDSVCGVHGELGHQQADGEAAADALDTPRRPPPLASAPPGPQWRSARDLLPVVSCDDPRPT